MLIRVFIIGVSKVIRVCFRFALLRSSSVITLLRSVIGWLTKLVSPSQPMRATPKAIVSSPPAFFFLRSATTTCICCEFCFVHCAISDQNLDRLCAQTFDTFMLNGCSQLSLVYILFCLFVYFISLWLFLSLSLSVGFPAMVVVISLAATQTAGYGTEDTCWLDVSNGLIWAFIAPAITVISVSKKSIQNA